MAVTRIALILLSLIVPASAQTWPCNNGSVPGDCTLSFVATPPTWKVSTNDLGDAQVGVAFSANIPPASAPSGESLTYSASSVPAGLTFSAASLTISGTPTTSGTQDLVVTATAAGGSVSQTFTIEVSPAATPTPTPTPTAGLLYPPTFAALASPNIYQVLLQNATSSATNAGYVTFGMPLADKLLPRGSCVEATVNGTAVPAQYDLKTSYSDGYGRFGLVTIAAPEVPANTTYPVLISPASCGTSTVSAKASSGSIVLTSGSQKVTLDLATIESGTPEETWMNGPLAMESRFRISEAALSPGFEVVLDHRTYADGTIRDEVSFANDYFGPTTFSLNTMGNPFTYGVTWGSQSWPVVNEYSGQVWHYVQRTSGVDNQGLNVQYNPAALASVGIIPNYNLTMGLQPSALYSIPSGSDVGPLGSNGITPYMPTTGGRADIGTVPVWWAVWAVTQNATQYQAAMQYAEAGVPWNIRIGSGWVSVLADNNVWVGADNSNGVEAIYPATNAPISAIGQPVSTTVFTPDVAHQPDLYWLPYITSGDHYWLDRLQAQAAYGAAAQWPNVRNGAINSTGNDNAIFGNQLRAGAWTLRELQEAAYGSPDGSNGATYFQQIANDNWNWVVGQTLTSNSGSLASVEGTIHGFIIAPYEYSCCTAPWQQHYFATVAASAAAQGYAQAQQWLVFESNFDVGQVQNLGVDMALYALGTFTSASTGSGQVYWNNTTNSWAYAQVQPSWSAVETETVASGSSNTTATCTYQQGFCDSNGDYGALLIAALSDEYNAICPTDATLCSEIGAAITKAQAEGLPYTNSSYYQSDPNWSIGLNKN